MTNPPKMIVLLMCCLASGLASSGCDDGGAPATDTTTPTEASSDTGGVDGGSPDAPNETGAPDGAPPACTYERDYGCYVCAGGQKGKDYSVGCTATDNCRAFCGPRPAGWTECSYRGPGESQTLCNGWSHEPGTLAGCTKDSNTGYYHCPFCFSATYAVTTASDGSNCYTFSDSCIPVGFTYASSCPP